MTEDEIPVLPKPDELLALHGVTAELFGILKDWFDVPDGVTIDLREVDSAVAELGDHVMIAAMAMRKLQALHLLSTPGVMTTTDVVISIIGDLDRALIQAPNMHLKRAAESTDWDAELAGLDLDMNLFDSDTFDSDADDRSDPSARADHPSLSLEGDESPDGIEVFEIDMSEDELDADDLELVRALLDLDMLDGVTSDDLRRDDGLDGDSDAEADDAASYDAARDDDGDSDDEHWVVVEYVESDDLDARIDHFRGLHSLLHEAVRGVLEASQGEIRYFV